MAQRIKPTMEKEPKQKQQDKEEQSKRVRVGGRDKCHSGAQLLIRLRRFYKR